MDDLILTILTKRFGKDTLLSLATSSGDHPSVRHVDAIFLDGAFYVITYALSGKMKEIETNQNIALCGDWFTAKGTAVSIGSFSSPKNASIAAALREAFASWIDNGHSDLSDPNTIILKLTVDTGMIFYEGKRYDFPC